MSKALSNSYSFRQKHLLAVLEEYDESKGPLDLWISRYFRAHTSLGSKDRPYISDTVYGVIRWRGLIDYILAIKRKPFSWALRCELFSTLDPQTFLQDETIPQHARVSMPEALFQELVLSFGKEKAIEISLACGEVAPTTVRVNPKKTDRKSLLEVWQNKEFLVSACEESPYGICFEKKINFFSLPEFKEGFFEIQDEASQLVAFLVEAKPGDHVLDFCAGSGGKTLAFAPFLEGKGQIYIHDVRESILLQAKNRMRRAGIENVQFIHSEEKKRLNKLKHKMDWVLVDAPCSGTGTLRRNPDMKWKFTMEQVSRLVAEQRVIFEEAFAFVKKGGSIVYATCSILKKENEEQLAYFLEKFPLQLVKTFQTIPEKGKMDGFFAAVFRCP